MTPEENSAAGIAAGLDSGARFYAELPVVTDLGESTRLENCAPLPDDWHIALCDVRNSTIAIQTGSYKNVNTLGAAAITAVESSVASNAAERFPAVPMAAGSFIAAA